MTQDGTLDRLFICFFQVAAIEQTDIGYREDSNFVC